MSLVRNVGSGSSLQYNENPSIRKMSMFSVILNHLKEDKLLWIMILPGIAYYLIFNYVPMYGIIIAFEKYSPFRGMLGGPWVGFKWFNEFFQSIYCWRVIRNTLLLNIYSILLSFPVPIILALLLNEITNIKFKKISQTISYMPHFVSQVVMVGMVVNFLSPSTGIINHLLNSLGISSVNFMIEPGWFRSIYISSSIWQEAGWSSIIYLAALSGIDMELYEAAKSDGANKIRQIWHIALPGLMPTIIILLLLSMGRLLSIGYEKIILMYNPANYETADVINTYVFRRGLVDGDYSFATAVGLFQSVISYILLLVVNKLSKRVNGISLW